MEIKKGMVLFNVDYDSEWKVIAYDGVLVTLESLATNQRIERLKEEVKNDFVIKG